jgi:peptidyl-prolyl cis-trans isomerase SurA
MKHLFLKRSVIIILISLSFVSISKADDPVVVTVDNQKVTKSGFLKIYNKNNPQSSYDIKALKEYMDLFINYKLKVVEAEHLGFDTVSTFKSEFESYRDQLAKPYMTDKETDERILRETYDRLLTNIHARHILLRCSELNPPSDTLAQFNLAMEAYNKLKAGEPWDSVYNKYSQETSSYKTKGDLGYFTVLQMTYPFESACYNAKVGEFNKPIHSKFGYHVIQVLDRKPSKGEIKVQHIMITFPENADKNAIDSAKSRIAEVYQKLNAGEKFENLAKQYSDDKRSAAKGGEINWFGTGQMIHEFENVAFSLEKDGEYSKPFRTTFGWHIVKRIAIRPISSFDDLKEKLNQRVQRDTRGQFGKSALIQKVKAELKITDNKKELKLLEQVVDSSIYAGQWKAFAASKIAGEKLFTVGDKTYYIKDFAEYLSKQRFKKPQNIEMSIKYFYGEYVNDIVLNFENSRLEAKYPDLKFLLQEYHDGILLFNLMEQKIWSQAGKDTIGLLKYYNDHKDTYVWGERIEALVVSSKEKEQADQAYKFANDFNEGKISADKIWKSICKDTTEACFNCQFSLFEKGDNLILDSLGWEKGITPIVFRESKYGFFVKKGKVPAKAKTLDEARGNCIADYQMYLEKQYLDELRKKYSVVVDEKVLESIKK